LEDSPQRGSRPRSGVALLASAGNIRIHSRVQSRFTRQVSETSLTGAPMAIKVKKEPGTRRVDSSPTLFFLCFVRSFFVGLVVLEATATQAKGKCFRRMKSVSIESSESHTRRNNMGKWLGKSTHREMFRVAK